MYEAIDFLFDEIKITDAIILTKHDKGDIIHALLRLRARAIELAQMAAGRDVEVAELVDEFDSYNDDIEPRLRKVEDQ